jgi:2-polyprenyl-3-methyl-5-hydroxy-6-metoxy-1,4-benzoquinol methylase
MVRDSTNDYDMTTTPMDMQKEKKKAWEESSDFANYFCTYGFIYHQKQMLEDDLRMQCYRDAIFENPNNFKDKVVLDVGTGSGILSIWAAQAGARKVYAVEVCFHPFLTATVIDFECVFRQQIWLYKLEKLSKRIIKKVWLLLSNQRLKM